jgi:predicted metalloprotease with PDZ domain
MKYFTALLILWFVSFASSAQVKYTIKYQDSTSSNIQVIITPGTALKAPISFVMPRSIPGTYGISLYDRFILKLTAVTTNGNKIPMVKDAGDAPRWYINDTGKTITKIEYEVDLKGMENKMAPSDASIIRSRFAGILNYSILGWIDGTQLQPVQCTVNTFEGWPVFSSHTPSTQPGKTNYTFTADNYYSLADGQIFLGPGFRIKEFTAVVPLYIVSYAQTQDEYLDDYGWQGTYSMAILNDYFGEVPFKNYTIFLRSAIPTEPGNTPPFGMEHLQSSTFFGDVSAIRKTAMSPEERIRTMPTFLHHMGHSFIPLRCYGDAYRPFVLEIPQVINNIWFNEGFMWFLPYDTLHLARMKTRFDNNVYHTAPEIKKMTLQQLSQTASTQYSVDFRLGQGIYSRGALMALEMDTYLKAQSGGKKSMKNVLRYLYQWSKENKRAFTLEEFPNILNKACGIDLRKIYDKWQLPIE